MKYFSKIYGSWKGIQKEKYEIIFKLFKKEFKGKMLDIGAGNGYFQEFLKDKISLKNMTCIDIDKNSINQISDEKWVIGDGNKLPFEDEEFDFIISIDAMHLINDDFKRVLKKNGKILFSIFKKKMKRLENIKGFEIEKELITDTKEKEYIILARKITSSLKS